MVFSCGSSHHISFIIYSNFFSSKTNEHMIFRKYDFKVPYDSMCILNTFYAFHHTMLTNNKEKWYVHLFAFHEYLKLRQKSLKID